MHTLHLNIDHIATIRQQRREGYPCLLETTDIALAAGASGITVHLREDRRHIQDTDVYDLRAHIPSTHHMTLEMGATDEMLDIACRVRPDLITLVPESRAELTTEGGLDVIAQAGRLELYIARLQREGLRVSLFIEPDQDTIQMSQQIGADSIELHTGRYAHAYMAGDYTAIAAQIERMAVYASGLGLQVNAGHGLSSTNLPPISQITEISELHIGYAVIGRSIYVGLAQAVSEIMAVIR